MCIHAGSATTAGSSLGAEHDRRIEHVRASQRPPEVGSATTSRAARLEARLVTEQERWPEATAARSAVGRGRRCETAPRLRARCRLLCVDVEHGLGSEVPPAHRSDLAAYGSSPTSGISERRTGHLVSTMAPDSNRRWQASATRKVAAVVAQLGASRLGDHADLGCTCASCATPRATSSAADASGPHPASPVRGGWGPGGVSAGSARRAARRSPRPPAPTPGPCR